MSTYYKEGYSEEWDTERQKSWDMSDTHTLPQ